MNDMQKTNVKRDHNEDPVIIKYNNDLAFRRMVAFNRVYHAKNLKARVAAEAVLLAVSVAVALTFWFSRSTMANSTYIMYAFIIVAAVLIARLLRALLNRSRIKPADPSRAEREYIFREDGFMFGPVNETGELLSTRWGDIDRVYVTDGVLYFLCMSRKHWAAVDRRLMVNGDWNELIEHVMAHVPRFKVYGVSFKK